MDPEVKKYFLKILNSFVFGFIWMFSAAIAGLYFKLGILNDAVQWYNILFYVLLLLTFLLLLRFYYYCWKGERIDSIEADH